jgi:putative transposase
MLLVRSHPHANVPATRTMERWLGLHRRRRTRLRGPHLPSLVRTAPTAPNAVWTVDFKGWFRTGDGTKIEPLTVRDLHSRCVLLVLDLPRKDYRTVRRALTRVFRRHGLPQAIWTDNGPPFGGEGALGLTRLSVWWLRLGIRVEYGRPARPGDNASHEHMHGVFQREIANSPAVHPAAQYQRIRRWLKIHNTVRPQGALRGAAAAMIYRNSARRLPTRLPNWPVRPQEPVRLVSRGGWISYCGKKRLIGRPFAGQPISLHQINAACCEIYLGPHLLGHLHLTETLLRAARRQTPVSSREGAAPPPLPPSPNISGRNKPPQSVTS